MWNSFFWELFAASSLIIGGIIASRLTLSNKILGMIMAFGAGTLISAVSYELIYEAVKLGKGTGFPALILAFAGGAILIMLANSMIPESYKHGGKIAGPFNILGFSVAVGVVLMELAAK